MAQKRNILVNGWGGYNTTKHETQIRDNELSGGQNIRILDSVMEKVKGYTKYNSATLGVSDYVQPWEYQTRDHDKYLLVNANTSLILADNTSSSGDIDTLIKDGFTANKLFSQENYFNQTWMANGDNAPHVTFEEKPYVYINDFDQTITTRYNKSGISFDTKFLTSRYISGDDKYLYSGVTSQVRRYTKGGILLNTLLYSST